MKKSDLKTGMHLKFNSGSVVAVLLGTENGDKHCRVDPKSYGGFHQEIDRLFDYYGLENYAEDLREINNINITGDVDEVYSMYGNLLWKRKSIFQKDNIVKNNQRTIFITENSSEESNKFSGICIAKAAESNNSIGEEADIWIKYYRSKCNFGDEYKLLKL